MKKSIVLIGLVLLSTVLSATEYKMISSLDELADGAKVIIATNKNATTYSTYKMQDNPSRDVDYTVSGTNNDILTPSDGEKHVWTIEIKTVNSTKYYRFKKEMTSQSDWEDGRAEEIEGTFYITLLRLNENDKYFRIHMEGDTYLADWTLDKDGDNSRWYIRNTAESSVLGSNNNAPTEGNKLPFYIFMSAMPHTATLTLQNHGMFTSSSSREDLVVPDVLSTTLPAVTADDDYTFLGWYDAPKGGTKVGDAGDTYKVVNDITLYAQYTYSGNATITMDVQGKGTNQGEDEYNTTGGAAITLPNVVGDGRCEFLGWAESASATSAEYVAGAQYAARTSAATLYAIYSINQPLSYYAVAATGGTITFEDSECETTMTAVPETGYLFYKWLDNNSTDPERVAAYSEATYEAAFAPGYTVTLVDGSSTENAKAFTGCGIQTAPSGSTKPGYNFAGWASTNEATTPDITFPYEPAANCSIYAVYTKKTAIEISQNVDPTDELMVLNGDAVAVTLSDRALQAGIWNTFCVPFAITNLSSTPLAGAQVAEYVESTVEGEDVTLGFNYTTTMEAGKPYLVKPATAIAAPMNFGTVTIAATAGQSVEIAPVTFIGTLKPKSDLTAGDKNTLFLNASGELFYADSNDTSTFPGLRAYFQIESGSQSPVRISFGKALSTSLQEQSLGGIDCQKIVRDGRLYIIRNGESYNAQGVIVK